MGLLYLQSLLPMTLQKYDNVRDSRLDPLAQFGSLSLSVEQKHVIHYGATYQRGQRIARKNRKDDLLIVPTGVAEHLNEQYSVPPGTRAAIHAKRMAKHLLVVHFISSKQRTKGYTSLDYVGLMSSVLQRHIGKSKSFSYKTVLKNLEKWGVIECDKSYYHPRSSTNTTAYSKSFRFTNAYRSVELVMFPVRGLKYREIATRDRSTRRAAKCKSQGLATVFIDENLPHYQWLKKGYSRVSICQEVDQYIEQSERERKKLNDKTIKFRGKKITRSGRVFTADTARSYRATVGAFNTKQFLGTYDFGLCSTNGRLHTGLTSLFRAGRDYLQIDGKRTHLADPDLASSQVYLLLPMLLRTTIGTRYPDEFEEFIQMVLAENFYQNLATQLKAHCKILGKDLIIKNPKISFFTHTIYSKNHAPTLYRRAFNECFPLINAALKELVKEYVVDPETKEQKVRYLNLSILLQRQESELFLNQIVGRLHDELGNDAVLLTLHDGFLCQPEHLETVRRVMVQVLTNHTGYSPTVRTSIEKNEFNSRSSVGDVKPKTSAQLLPVHFEVV